MKISSVIALLLFLPVLTGTGYAKSDDNSSDGILRAESEQAKVMILISSLPDAQFCRAPSSWRWGAENACPTLVVAKVEVILNEEQVFVPLSAFADLGDPRAVRIEKRDGSGRFAVVIIGGDAATFYSASLEFRSGLLLERMVRHGEFPTNAWEQTTYMFNQ